MFSLYEAALLIVIRRAVGDETGVEELLDVMRNEVRHSREAGRKTGPASSPDFDEGLTLYLAGEREKGLALITKAARDGFYVDVNNAVFQELYDDPGFTPIRLIQETRQARERKRFLDIVCRDNPYVEVWRPLPETCEGLREKPTQ